MEQEKSRALRRARTQAVVNRQLAIARRQGSQTDKPGVYRKRHAMDCGNPQCGLCGNPRHGSNSASAKTVQELRSDGALKKIEFGELALASTETI